MESSIAARVRFSFSQNGPLRYLWAETGPNCIDDRMTGEQASCYGVNLALFAFGFFGISARVQ
jgi:hypothetical protein